MSLPSYLPQSQRGLDGVEPYSKEQDEQQMLELLAYYRHKVDNQEKERVEWLGELEQMRFNVEKVHEEEAQILALKKQMDERQKALSDSHLSIYDEKITINSLRLEYEDLCKQDRTEKKRIKELTLLNEDIENKLANVNFKDCRSEDQKKRVPLGKKERSLQKLTNEQRGGFS